MNSMLSAHLMRCGGCERIGTMFLAALFTRRSSHFTLCEASTAFASCEDDFRTISRPKTHKEALALRLMRMPSRGSSNSPPPLASAEYSPIAHEAVDSLSKRLATQGVGSIPRLGAHADIGAASSTLSRWARLAKASTPLNASIPLERATDRNGTMVMAI